MPLKWKKVWVSDETFESAGVFDVNNDGVLDIVSVHRTGGVGTGHELHCSHIGSFT